MGCSQCKLSCFVCIQFVYSSLCTLRLLCDPNQHMLTGGNLDSFLRSVFHIQSNRLIQTQFLPEDEELKYIG